VHKRIIGKSPCFERLLVLAVSLRLMMEELRRHILRIDSLCETLSDGNPSKNRNNFSHPYHHRGKNSPHKSNRKTMMNQSVPNSSYDLFRKQMPSENYMTLDELENHQSRIQYAPPHVSVIVSDRHSSEEVYIDVESSHDIIPSPSSSSGMDEASHQFQYPSPVDESQDVNNGFQHLPELLKPAPLKKARRSFIPDEKKDEKYWERRKRNNEAAKRSREARRSKEVEVSKRSDNLEKDNDDLKKNVDELRMRNRELEETLKIYKSLLQSKNLLPQ